MRTFIAGTMLLVACGGSESTATLDPNAPVNRLSAAQQELFCNWDAQLYGGYGKTLVCDGGFTSSSGPQDEADCVSEYMQGFSAPDATFGACAATVGQVQTCLQWLVQNLCVASPAPAPAACTVVLNPPCSSG